MIIRPGESCTISITPLQNNLVVAGLSLNITIKQSATRVVEVNAASMTEDYGTYYYTWAGISAVGEYDYVIKSGANVLKTGEIQVQGLAITGQAAQGAGATPYTTVDDMVTRIGGALADLDITNPPDIPLLINQAIRAIQNKFKVLRDDFLYSIAQGTRTYLINGVAPYPYEWENVFYNIGVNQVEISKTDRGTVEADVAGANTVVYRYCRRNDGANINIDLNAVPVVSISSGLRIYGPYHPVTVASGDGLPFETKWDRLLEALVVEWATAGYSADNNDKAFEGSRVKAAMDDMELQVVLQ